MKEMKMEKAQEGDEDGEDRKKEIERKEGYVIEKKLEE